MNTRLLIGQSDFRQFRLRNGYYIDKSLFIEELLQIGFETVLLPRPRRFGKTLNLSMLRYFFDQAAPAEENLFQGLAIEKSPLFEQHHHRYPVIYMTFKDAKGQDWADCFKYLQQVIHDAYAAHRYLLKSDILFTDERVIFEQILANKVDKAHYENSLKQLSELLYRYHHETVVILIDEYDTPIHSGYGHGYYEDIINFMRHFLSGGLKDNPCLFKGVLTGILRVAKESIFSGLNNLGVYTLLDNDFSTVFGFTEAEVKMLLASQNKADSYEKVAYWYNGYLFGNTIIYNPWSVLSYVANSNPEPRPYWVNTANTSMIDQLVTNNGQELREELYQLLNGQTIIKPISDNIIMRELSYGTKQLWSFLLFSGYLKFSRKSLSKNLRELSIPNEEVRQIYEEMIERWFETKVKLPQLEGMLNSLQHGDMQLFERMLHAVVTQVMSYHDLSGEPEKVYQALVLGMLVWLSPYYEIRSNREAGYGRYDLMFRPKEMTRQGIILEFKRVEPDEEPKTVLAEAMQQLEVKQYATELQAVGIKSILQIAIVFRGKELWVQSDTISYN